MTCNVALFRTAPQNTEGGGPHRFALHRNVPYSTVSYRTGSYRTVPYSTVQFSTAPEPNRRTFAAIWMSRRCPRREARSPSPNPAPATPCWITKTHNRRQSENGPSLSNIHNHSRGTSSAAIEMFCSVGSAMCRQQASAFRCACEPISERTPPQTAKRHI